MTSKRIVTQLTLDHPTTNGTEKIPDPWVRPASVFAKASVWKYRYTATLFLDSITGGTPSDPKIAKGWLATRLGGEAGKDALLEQRLKTVIAERAGADPEAMPSDVMDAALEEAAVNVDGFKRTTDGHLYVEGRTVKAMIKENASIGLGSGVVPARLGLTKKGAPSFLAEHVMVVEDVIPITRNGAPLTEPDTIDQHFVHTYRGNSIGYSEVCSNVEVTFTVVSDLDLTDLWPVVWSLAENNGLGARRSQGSGRFVVTTWDRQ